MTAGRSLLDGDTTPTQERANIFDDEFEVDEEFDGIADGFRPNMGADEGVSHTRQDEVDGQPIRSVSAHYGPDAISPLSTVQTRSSVRKSRTYANPFSSPDDDEPTSPTGTERNQSLEFEPDVRRSVSSASSSQFAPTHSPRFGAGPSHPYSIYPQGTMGRTLSQTTASTVRAPSTRQSYSQSRPQHPYAMYPQGVGDDMDDDEDEGYAMQQNPVPVGFPGLGGDYTRRLGPDGEDQDLIGELGHTEQLPPYTRYPEDGPEKMPLLMPTAPTALHSVAPIAGTDPSMALMHTRLTPSEASQAPPQSMTDESVLHRQSSRMSGVHLMSSSRSSMLSHSGTSFGKGKKWSDKNWKERRTHKFCGIPAWCILLAVSVVVFVTAVIGGVIGGFVAGGRHARDQPPTVTVVTSLYDASLIASPTAAAPPTGTYALTLGKPEETQNACLANDYEKAAWSCDLSPNSALGIDVGSPPDGKGSGASIMYASRDPSIGYGAQVNNMNTSFAQFLTVQDNDDKQNGPAFYFQQFYDKVVVVPEEAISVERSGKKKRGFFTPGWRMPEEFRHRKQVAQPGEQPWFCVWNGTFLEGFIYVTEKIATSTAANTSSIVTKTTLPSLPPSAPAAQTASITAPAASPAPTEPPDIITKTWSAPLTTATFIGPASDLNGWASSIMSQASGRQAFESRIAEQHRVSKRAEVSDDDYWSHLPLFPYLVKLEERRLPNNPIIPYCQQYQILDNGNANWVGDADGNPIRVELTELDPDYSSADVITSSKRLARRQNTPNACHCQWMSGE